MAIYDDSTTPEQTHYKKKAKEKNPLSKIRWEKYINGLFGYVSNGCEDVVLNIVITF